MKKHFLVLGAVFILAISCLFSQPGGPGGPPEPEDPPVGIPIDGGAGILLLIGGAIALKFKKSSSKK